MGKIIPSAWIAVLLSLAFDAIVADDTYLSCFSPPVEQSYCGGALVIGIEGRVLYLSPAPVTDGCFAWNNKSCEFYFMVTVSKQFKHLSLSIMTERPESKSEVWTTYFALMPITGNTKSAHIQMVEQESTDPPLIVFRVMVSRNSNKSAITYGNPFAPVELDHLKDSITFKEERSYDSKYTGNAVYEVTYLLNFNFTYLKYKIDMQQDEMVLIGYQFRRDLNSSLFAADHIVDELQHDPAMLLEVKQGHLLTGSSWALKLRSDIHRIMMERAEQSNRR